MSFRASLRSYFVVNRTETHRSGCCYHSCEPHHFHRRELPVPLAVKISSSFLCICHHLVLV